MSHGEEAFILAREFRELCRKKGTHPLETLKQQLSTWRRDYDLEPHEYINLGNSSGKVPLHFAAQLRHDGLTEHLLSLRADPNITTVRGHTALIFASGRGRSETVLSLLEAGAKSRVRLVNGDTALSMGIVHGLNEAALEALREAERTETQPWLDFTADERAIEAQADHVMASLHKAQWAGEVPDPVAELLEQREAARKHGASAMRSSAEALATILQPVWNCEEAFAEALLLECCKYFTKKRAQIVLRESLLIVPTEFNANDLQLFAKVLLRALSRWLSEVSDRLVGEERVLKQVKRGRSLATSAILSALKELHPLSFGLTVKDLEADSPPWVAIELLSPPVGVELVSDASHLESILRRLCHAEAWGTDFANALRWLRQLRPSAEAKLEEHRAFHTLASAYIDGATAACKAGNSLRRHLRDHCSFLEEVCEVLDGANLDSLHDVVKASNVPATPKSKFTGTCQPPQCGPPFWQLPPHTSITWVDDAVSWFHAESAISASKLAAIDTEWWDVGGGPALIQIAVGGDQSNGPNCFLIDTWHYDGSMVASDLRKVVAAGMMRLFSQDDLKIVGWSFQQDAKRLQELCGGPNRSLNFSVLDLQPIAASAVASFAETACMEGLAITCARFLGKPLDKTEQCSDWRRRPLSNSQRQYAALDAVVLLELHSVLMDGKTCAT